MTTCTATTNTASTRMRPPPRRASRTRIHTGTRRWFTRTRLTQGFTTGTNTDTSPGAYIALSHGLLFANPPDGLNQSRSSPFPPRHLPREGLCTHRMPSANQRWPTSGSHHTADRNVLSPSPAANPTGREFRSTSPGSAIETAARTASSLRGSSCALYLYVTRGRPPRSAARRSSTFRG